MLLGIWSWAMYCRYVHSASGIWGLPVRAARNGTPPAAFTSPVDSDGGPFCHEFVVAFQLARQTSWLRPAPVHGSVTVVTGNTTPTWPRWSGEAPIPLRTSRDSK